MDECVPFKEEAILLSEPFIESFQENPTTDLPEPFVIPQNDPKIRLNRKRKALPPTRDLRDVS